MGFPAISSGKIGPGQRVLNLMNPMKRFSQLEEISSEVKNRQLTATLIGRSCNLKKTDPIIEMSRRVDKAPAIQEATPASRMAAADSGPGVWCLNESD